jgi:hypothetical protein
MDVRPAFVERRTIEFSERGVLQVVNASLRAASSFGLPSMLPDSVHLFPQEGRAAFRYGSGQTARSVLIDAEQLGALLLAYCIRKKVPLPRAAGKAVCIEANSVLLTFQLEHGEAATPDVGESSNIQSASVRAWSWVGS